MLTTLAISMHVRCAKCSTSIHLGAVVDRVRCHRCGAIELLPADRWLRAMDSVAHDGASMPEGKSITHDEDEMWIVSKKQTPTCASCAAPIPIASIERGRVRGMSFCGGCGAKIGLRPVPEPLRTAFPGISHFFEEDGVQLKNPDAPVPDPSAVISIRCPDCGGNIQPDGSSRAVRCPYCSVLAVLPQATWKRLHTGKNDPHTFYLVHDAAIPRRLMRADADWGSVNAVCCDPLFNIYIVAEDRGHNDGYMVIALDYQLKTKWVTKGIAIEDEGRIAWRNDGVLVVWSPRRYSAILLRAADGIEVGKAGGEQPQNIDRHWLDLSGAESLAVDFDGTFLFAKNDRLARCLPDGSGTLTWPAGQGLLGGLFAQTLTPFTKSDEENADSHESVGNRPTKVRDGAVRIGWDGRTYLQRNTSLVCYDRNGTKLYRAELPDKGGDYDFGADAHGNVYLNRYLEYQSHGIYRVLPGGKCDLILDGRNPQTPMRDDSRMTVRADGMMFVIAYDRRIRVISPDGRVVHCTPTAIKEDESWAKRKAEEQKGDKVR